MKDCGLNVVMLDSGVLQNSSATRSFTGELITQTGETATNDEVSHQLLVEYEDYFIVWHFCTYIRNTPNLVLGIGAFRQAEKARPSTRRVSDGAMMPSSHSRAVAK